jgi:nicotinamide riboside kinase
MEKREILKIVLTGPESSGKSTLAAALAAALHAPLAPEFARYYLDGLKQPYTADEVDFMERGQQIWEHFYTSRATKYVVLDTDWTVYYVWRTYTLQQVLELPKVKMDGVFYFLCQPDFPWQPDPLREHPDERSVLFDQYVQLLEAVQAPYVVLEGPPDTRLKKALEIIQKL